MRLLALIGAATAFASTAAALEPVTVKGNAFYAGNERWYIRGVDYLPGGPSLLMDPLADEKICKRDLEYFKDLGINAIRVYTIDNSKNHDVCMKLLEDAGIYLILDVNTPTRSINRNNPKSSYNGVYLQHVFATMDVMGKYKNTALFFSANEVVDDKTTTPAATYVKALTRDMHNYMTKHLKRQIPIGYSAADVDTNRVQMAHYLNCGDDATARSDFVAFNDYSYCGEESSYTISGWDKKVETYMDYSIPIFFSEFGCNKIMPRTFPEIKDLYSPEMTSVFSGGLVYEFSQETNNYGLVDIKNNGKGAVTPRDDYKNLKKQYAAVQNPSGLGNAKTSGKISECPAFEKGVWEANNTLPAFPKDAEQYMEKGAGKPLGNPNTPNGSNTPDTDDTDNTNDNNDSNDSADDGKADNEKSGADKLSLGLNAYMYMLAAVAAAAALVA